MLGFWAKTPKLQIERLNCTQLIVLWEIWSEFEIVIIPVLTQHFKMLFRNLIYTGLTRARKYAFFVGTRKALAMAVKNQDTSCRQTALKELLTGKAEKKIWIFDISLTYLENSYLWGMPVGLNSEFPAISGIFSSLWPLPLKKL